MYIFTGIKIFAKNWIVIVLKNEHKYFLQIINITIIFQKNDNIQEHMKS